MKERRKLCLFIACAVGGNCTGDVGADVMEGKVALLQHVMSVGVPEHLGVLPGYCLGQGCLLGEDEPESIDAFIVDRLGELGSQVQPVETCELPIDKSQPLDQATGDPRVLLLISHSRLFEEGRLEATVEYRAGPTAAAGWECAVLRTELGWLVDGCTKVWEA